jgi:hypothetical protein
VPWVPAAPDFRFAPAGAETTPDYAAAPSLPELFPLHATAPVTARDHFVVAFTRRELLSRLEAFRDRSIPDEEIRRRWFNRTRSRRYAPGDTRGWKLAAARQTLAALDDWQAFIRPCQYRPLDWRWIFWHPAMIDWPRVEVTRYLMAQTELPTGREGERGREGEWGNKVDGAPLPLSSSPPLPLALIARRQLPPSEPCSYFWATSALTLDGIIRNDNRGSESLFPVVAESTEQACYAYALFHSSSYRQQCADALRTGFPRVLPACAAGLTASLAGLGRKLLDLHTQRPPPLPPSAAQRLLATIAPRFPTHSDGRVWICEDYSIAAADEATWQFRVGAHQVARKWLADRRGRPLTDADVAWYGIILDTIVQTGTLAAEIDAAIAHCGGIPAAFRPVDHKPRRRAASPIHSHPAALGAGYTIQSGRARPASSPT